jgi:hypothetical protein
MAKNSWKIEARELGRGDRFHAIPLTWLDYGTVIESSPYGDLWCVKYSNPDILNPPGVWYGSPERPVRLITSPKRHQPQRELAGDDIPLKSHDRILIRLTHLSLVLQNMRAGMQSLIVDRAIITDPDIYPELRDDLLHIDKAESRANDLLAEAATLHRNLVAAGVRPYFLYSALH